MKIGDEVVVKNDKYIEPIARGKQGTIVAIQGELVKVKIDLGNQGKGYFTIEKENVALLANYQPRHAKESVEPYKMEIKIKYFDKDLPKIEKINKGDWIDLRCAERVAMRQGEYKLLRLGVGMEIPEGYEALVVPRSSTPSKFGIILANSIGVIDNSYNGDEDQWRFPAIAIRDTIIEKGDRICQFRIFKNQPPIEFEEVEHLNEISRGGIGSTGKN